MKQWKKWTAAALCCILALCMGGCQSKKGVLTMGGGEVPAALYTYYVDQAISEAQKIEGESLDLEKGSVEKKAVKTWVQERAEQYCRDFVTVNTQFAQRSLSLTGEQKAAISSAVAAIWNIYRPHYQQLGLDKTVLTQVQENSKKRETLFMALYDTNGEQAVEESQLKTWYQQNNVAFLFVTGSFTTQDITGKTVEVTSGVRANITKAFDRMAAKINQGSAMAEVLQESDETKNQSPQTQVMTKTSKVFPESFFEEISNMKEQQAKVLAEDETIYLVQKVNPLGTEEALYQDNRTASLKQFKAADFDQQIADWGKALSVKQNRRQAGRIYQKMV